MHTVLPGFVETEGFPQRSALKSRLLKRFVIEVDDVARARSRTRSSTARREITVPWFPYRLSSILQALVPGLFARFRRGDRQQKGE